MHKVNTTKIALHIFNQGSYATSLFFSFVVDYKSYFHTTSLEYEQFILSFYLSFSFHHFLK